MQHMPWWKLRCCRIQCVLGLSHWYLCSRWKQRLHTMRRRDLCIDCRCFFVRRLLAMPCWELLTPSIQCVHWLHSRVRFFCRKFRLLCLCGWILQQRGFCECVFLVPRGGGFAHHCGDFAEYLWAVPGWLCGCCRRQCMFGLPGRHIRCQAWAELLRRLPQRVQLWEWLRWLQL